jgi:hypothetical protein
MEDHLRSKQDEAEAPAGLPLGVEAQLVSQQLAPQIEKFSAVELTTLRNELMRSQLDSWQAADVAANFLAGHGYGASADNLREALTSMEMSRCSIDCLQAALEGVAYIQ